MKVYNIYTHSALDLQVANAALLGVWTEDVVVLVDQAIKLMLKGLDAGALVDNLELQVGGEHWDDLCNGEVKMSLCTD